jgi:hypothetical protein
MKNFYVISKDIVEGFDWLSDAYFCARDLKEPSIVITTIQSMIDNRAMSFKNSLRRYAKPGSLEFAADINYASIFQVDWPSWLMAEFYGPIEDDLKIPIDKKKVHNYPKKPKNTSAYKKQESIPVDSRGFINYNSIYDD